MSQNFLGYLDVLKILAGKTELLFNSVNEWLVGRF